METEQEKCIALLRDLGLNQLEAEIYTFLLPNEPMTAYRVGKAIGRPTANVYKSIENLARLGAVLVEEGTNRVCRAVPVEEFIRHTQTQFLEKTQAAQQVLALLQRPTFDERVYRIESVADVLKRSRDMLARCQRIAVLDAFPLSLEAVLPSLREAVARRVEVIVEVYMPVEIEGADVVVVPDGQNSLNAWQSEQLNLVIDGKEHLLALLSQDLKDVYQAVWSGSVYLSCLHHSGRMHEISLLRLIHLLNNNQSLEALRNVLNTNRFFRSDDIPGHRELLRRFGKVPPAHINREEAN